MAQRLAPWGISVARPNVELRHAWGDIWGRSGVTLVLSLHFAGFPVHEIIRGGDMIRHDSVVSYQL